MNNAPRIHGGLDGQGAPLHDFSTNSNACGPCPYALAAVQQADATRYPDPGYTDLRQRLADFYSVDSWRIVLACSASEFIFRISAWARQQGVYRVNLPAQAYGDYAHAARAWGLQPAARSDDANLAWACEPSSPLGQNHGPWPVWLLGAHGVAMLQAWTQADTQAWLQSSLDTLRGWK